MNIIRNTVIAAIAAAATILPSAAAASSAPADAVTAASQQNDNVDVDAILDEIQKLVEAYEKVVADMSQGKTVSESHVESLNADAVKLSEKMQTLGQVPTTPAQEQRATDLITRLYTVMQQLQ